MYDRNLIDYLPQAERGIKEFDAILTKAEQPEVALSWGAIDNAMKDQFIEDATENGVSRWEKILNIFPKATDSLDVRKFTILTRINEQLPFTMVTLQEQLKTLCGEDGYEVTLDDAGVHVRVALSAKSNYNDVDALLKRVVPANTVVDLSLKYKQQSSMEAYTHEQLQNFTHAQLRNGVE